MLGGVLERAGDGQQLGLLDARRGRTATPALVTVPVLSSTIVSTRRVDSRISGPLISSPSWAPRPVPTSSAVGVASPSAHGQAMISTATAAVNANARSSPLPIQKPSVATDRDHDRHEDAGHAVGEPLHRRLAGLRVGDQARDLGQQVSAPTFVARTTRRPPALTVAPATSSPIASRPARTRRSAATGRRPVALLDDAVGGDLLARPHQKRSPAASCSTGTRRSEPSGSRIATSLAPSSSSAFSAAPAERLARASK